MRRPLVRSVTGRVVALTAVLGAALSAAAAQTALAAPATPDARAAVESPLAGLEVLLVNDDSARGADTMFGTDGKGLYVLRRALCAAGADVLVVAPWSQQSGASARMTTPGLQPVAMTVSPVTVPAAYAGDCSGAPSAGAVFGVCVQATACGSGSPSASPADAAAVALSRFAANYWPEGPDVVLSGTNFGQNVGTTTNHSGTVGAVVTAAEYDVPAIAVSAEVERNLALIPATPFAGAADFTVRLLGELVSRDKLSEDLVLNVNYPFVGEGETLGEPVLTNVGSSSDLGLNFAGDVGANGGTYSLLAGAPAPEPTRNADTTALAANDIAVSVIDGDWGGGTLPSSILNALR